MLPLEGVIDIAAERSRLARAAEGARKRIGIRWRRGLPIRASSSGRSRRRSKRRGRTIWKRPPKPSDTGPPSSACNDPAGARRRRPGGRGGRLARARSRDLAAPRGPAWRSAGGSIVDRPLRLRMAIEADAIAMDGTRAGRRGRRVRGGRADRGRRGRSAHGPLRVSVKDPELSECAADAPPPPEMHDPVLGTLVYSPASTGSRARPTGAAGR